LIPIDPCVAALAGVRTLEDLVRTVSEFRLEFTDAGALTINGVLITRADRTLVPKQIEAEVRNYFGSLVYPRAVPASVKIREAYRAAATAYLVGQDQPALGTSKRVDDGEPGIEKEDSSLRRHLDTSNPPPTVLISDGP